MKQRLARSIVLAVMCSGVASVASAQGKGQAPRRDDDEERVPVPANLYDNELTQAPSSKADRLAVDEVVRRCSFSRITRSGPPEPQRTQCEAAEIALVARGPQVLGPVLKRLCDRKVGGIVQGVLYAVLVRIGHISVVEPLVVALEKMEPVTEAVGTRSYIRDALRRLTYANVEDQAPDERREVKPSEWRAWFENHRTASREDMLRERVADAVAHVNDTPAKAFLAGRFLSSHEPTRAQGVAALEALKRRPDAPEWVAKEVDYALATAAAQHALSMPHLRN